MFEGGVSIALQLHGIFIIYYYYYYYHLSS